jgi:hypothetical protein
MITDVSLNSTLPGFRTSSYHDGDRFLTTVCGPRRFVGHTETSALCIGRQPTRLERSIEAPDPQSSGSRFDDDPQVADQTDPRVAANETTRLARV